MLSFTGHWHGKQLCCFHSLTQRTDSPVVLPCRKLLNRWYSDRPMERKVVPGKYLKFQFSATGCSNALFSLRWCQANISLGHVMMAPCQNKLSAIVGATTLLSSLGHAFPNKMSKWSQASARKRPRHKETPGPAVTRSESVSYTPPDPRKIWIVT